MQISKNKLGDMKAFHKNLEKKANLVLSDTCHHFNIQKQWEVAMEGDASCRIVAPREFVYRQSQAGWQASTQAMACWFTENKEDLHQFFNNEYIGFKPHFGLKTLPPKSRSFLQDSAAIEKALQDSVGFSKFITSEIQTVILSCKEELQRRKEAAENEHHPASMKISEDVYAETMMGVVAGETMEKDDEFNTEFRHSLNGNKHISQYAVRESRDSSTPLKEIADRPVPKLAPPQRMQLPGLDVERPATTKTGFAASSTARSMRAGKKNTQSVKPLQTFFKSKKDQDANEDDDDFA